MMLGIIRRNFKHLTLPTSMIRSHLDYCCSVWAVAPYKKVDTEALEKVQKNN